MSETHFKSLSINAIRIDGGTQSRVAIDNDVVAEYSAAIADGAVMPPITVMFDGTDYWLVDGFHRLHAAIAAVKTSIQAHVQTGTQREAQLFSFGANGCHGLRRTNEDKRKAVSAMLSDAEWVTWTDTVIAGRCAVSSNFVGTVRKSLSSDEGVGRVEREFVKKNGTKVKLKVTNTAKGKPTGGGTMAESSTATAPKASPTPAPLTEAEKQAEQIAQDAHGDTDIVEELAASYRVNEDLRAQLEVANADDLKAEAMKWRRISQIAARRQDELMETVNQREQELKRHVNTLRRIGKLVGVDDPWQVYAAVEKVIRSSSASGAAKLNNSDLHNKPHADAHSEKQAAFTLPEPVGDTEQEKEMEEFE
jgi:uncharacterized ParB-like nuclease family protein